MRSLFCVAAVAAAVVPSVKLNDGNSMPLVSLGGGYNQSESKQSIIDAVSAGWRGIDTALTYVDETGVGEGIKAVAASGVPRSELFVTSKVPGCVSQLTCTVTTKQNHKDNLKKLDLEDNKVDLLLVHWSPVTGCKSDADCKLIRTQWKAMEDIQKNGEAVSIGVSNYCSNCLDCLLSDPDLSVTPAVNQYEQHVGMAGTYLLSLREYCKSKGILPQAYSPLGPTFNQSAKNVLIAGDLTTSVGKPYGKSGAQVSLKWNVQRGIPVVTRSEEIAYLKQDVDLFDFNLTAADFAKLDASNDPMAKPCLFC